MSGLVRRTTQPDVRENEHLQAGAQRRTVSWMQRSGAQGFWPRVMPIAGRWSPPHSSKLSPLGETRDLLSYPSPKMGIGGQHHGRHSLACLFEYMF